MCRKVDVMKYSLKELRARKNWTQKETARQMGISVQTYNAWEKDISRIAIGKVARLADLFEVEIGEIRIMPEGGVIQKREIE